MTKPAILLIGGIDPQGCAGLSADIQTVSHHGCHPVVIATCLTEQTAQGIQALNPINPDAFWRQYQCAVADFEIAAIKIGLIPNLAIAKVIEKILLQHEIPVVLDPVMSATHGGEQPAFSALEFVRQRILPRITVLTPNLPEMAFLTDKPQHTLESQVKALVAMGLSSCLVKGGHASGEFVSDYFVDAFTQFYVYQKRLNRNVRGTGCVLSSSLACFLAKGEAIHDAVVLARHYINKGIRQASHQGPYQLFTHHQAELSLVDFPMLSYSPDLIGKSFNFPNCPERLGIYPVVDSADWVDRLLTLGVKTIQLRLKQTDPDFLHREIDSANHIAKQVSQSRFFVNDHWQSAIKVGAYGVHLGQEDLHDADLLEIEQSGLRLGISTHSYWELARALAINPSYIALGPIYETTSKVMPWQPQGLAKLAIWQLLLKDHLPLVAIGGIDVDRAVELKATGVGSVAMISAITQATDYQQVTTELLKIWQ